MSNATEFVQSLYAAFGRGDTKTIIENLDPAIQWWSNGDSKSIPWAGRRDGVAGAGSFFKALGENLDFEAFEPREFHAAGHTVTVLGRTRARNKNGGHGVFNCQWAHVFTVRNGKLAGFKEFYDTAAIERALAV